MADKLEKLKKPYDPEGTEGRIYKVWEESGYFNPDNLPGERSEAFTIVLPPPNVTGVLHLGHAYEDSLQDAIIRFERLRGKKTLWVPGTDSAAIATQARVEKDIQKEESKSRHDLGRDELVKRVADFAKQSENTILSQIKQMGASLDWSRYAYTLDDKRNEAVFTAFHKMYESGLIYRGFRIVNWDPKGQTTISDDEIVYEERPATLYTFKYSPDFPIAIATTRPETKVGDTAVAVHPDDSRYQQYIGKEYEVEFCGVPLKIKVVGDVAVDPEFGTGAVGVTPMHSHTDWDIAERHNLPKIQVIDEYAKMMVESDVLKGKKVAEAREIVVAWLKEQDLISKEEPITHNLALAERTGGTVEPLPKLQWFVAVSKPFSQNGKETTLKEIMRQAVESGAVEMPQENFQKIYLHWINNLHDWCISRQIWFGHRLPIWYKGDEVKCAEASPGEGWEQDSDVLDTWFSSALWTFSTLGWPEDTNDLKTFHPTNFMSPAYEILQLWVSRMIMMSGFLLGTVPFKKVMFHGLVRDKQGRKFSKSLGNGIDPLEIIGKYGADALRMSFLVGTAIGNDVRFDESKVKAYKHFANKLWNISRFILENTDPVDEEASLDKTEQELITEQQEVLKSVTAHLDNYRFHLAGEELYHYIWHRLADEILEESKANLTESRKKFLRESLRTILIALHPFMPFITEELWSLVKKDEDDLLMVQKWII
ncbi:MAG: valine--tRNA ligase [Candidatus Pacebacteria bacterium]|nr:valine--tRNA ligase [Candidatus Paceibacterota bacterium]